MLLFIADALLCDLEGGAEQSDAALLEQLAQRQPIWLRRCKELQAHQLESWLAQNSHHILLANSGHLAPELIELLSQEKGRYSLIEHDHHYLHSRNPCLYPRYTAPLEQRCHQRLFRNARNVYCQSRLHAHCLSLNSTDVNIINLACNFWSRRWLNTLQMLRGNSKSERYAVLQSRATVKNTAGALAYCRKHNLSVELIPPLPYPLFLQALSRCRGLVFQPLWVESFSRLVMEAALLGLRVHTNQHVGVLHEPWFQRQRQADGTWSPQLFTALEQQQQRSWQLIASQLPGSRP